MTKSLDSQIRLFVHNLPHQVTAEVANCFVGKLQKYLDFTTNCSVVYAPCNGKSISDLQTNICDEVDASLVAGEEAVDLVEPVSHVDGGQSAS